MANPDWPGPDGYTAFKTGTTEENDQIFMVPDCEEQFVLEDILSGCAHGLFGRCIFILDNKPENWKETIERLFEITEKLVDGQPAAEFESELSSCHLLCFSADEELAIAKVDLPESTVFSIIEDIARENDLNLVIKRYTKK